MTFFFHVTANSAFLNNGTPIGAKGDLQNTKISMHGWFFEKPGKSAAI